QIRNLIIRDLIKMKIVAGEKGDKNKYADIINIIDNAKYDASFKAFFNQDPGKDLLLDYARALVRQPEAGAGDFEKAIKTLRDIAEKDPRWSYNVSREMAEIMREARAQGVSPRLTARQWYETAHGFYI